jgi:peptidoglycan hydrolase-like protein with peptidoglycan-binding domain
VPSPYLAKENDMRKLIWSRGISASAVLAAAALSVGGVALAQPALAAPTCNNTTIMLNVELPAYNGDIFCGMSRGAHSAAVGSLQETLNICYWSGSATRGHVPAFKTRLVEDNDFGGKTKAALMSAQASAGAAVDGEYGPETRGTILFPTDTASGLRCQVFGR